MRNSDLFQTINKVQTLKAQVSYVFARLRRYLGLFLYLGSFGILYLESPTLEYLFFEQFCDL